MSGDPDQNTLEPAGRPRSVKAGDVPEALGRRYYVDGRGGAGLGFYVDAQVKAPAFRDQGRRLGTDRNDPNAIRDMVAVARHRDWAVVVVSGSAAFGREAWLAGRVAGLDVRGYRPTERDLQDLARRIGRRDALGPRSPRDRPVRDAVRPVERRDPLRVVEAVVRARLEDPAAQRRVLAAARERVADWLGRGARLEPIPARASAPPPDRQRQRGR